MSGPPLFYYDFNSPYAYLAAQRIDGLIPDAEWRPFAYPILLYETGRLEEAIGRDPAAVLAPVTERAAERGLPPVVPPQGWFRETWSLTPLRGAAYAEEQGRLKEFTAAAFRKFFVESRPLSEVATVAAAASEAGLDPAAVEAAIEMPDVKQRVKDRTDEAVRRGVAGIPTVVVGEQLFWGDDHLDEAAAAASA